MRGFDSRWRVNLALGAIAVVVAALLYLRPGTSPEPRHAVLPVALETIQRIEIERSGMPRIVLAREGGQWRMQLPTPARLDEIGLARLLDIARAHSQTRMAASELERFGLDQPWARLHYDGHRVVLGSSNALTGELYLMSGEYVYPVPVQLASGVPAHPARLLSHRLFAPDEQPVAFHFERFSVQERAGRWELDPPDAAASQDDLLRWVDQWRLASSMLTQPQSDAKLRGKLEVRLRDGRSVRLRIGRSSAFVLLREDEGLEYHFLPRLADVLLAAPGTVVRER